MSHEPVERRESGRERNHRALPSGRYLGLVTGTIEMIGFWTAVALPFLYVPLLVTGLDTMPRRITFVGLLALNVTALIVGHRHKRG